MAHSLSLTCHTHYLTTWLASTGSLPAPPDVEDLMRLDKTGNCGVNDDDDEELPVGWKQLRSGGYANLSGDWDEFPGIVEDNDVMPSGNCNALYICATNHLNKRVTVRPSM